MKQPITCKYICFLLLISLTSFSSQAQEQQQYYDQTTFETKPSLWQRFKRSKLVRAVKAITRIRIVIEPEALPEGRGDNY